MKTLTWIVITRYNRLHTSYRIFRKTFYSGCMMSFNVQFHNNQKKNVFWSLYPQNSILGPPNVETSSFFKYLNCFNCRGTARPVIDTNIINIDGAVNFRKTKNWCNVMWMFRPKIGVIFQTNISCIYYVGKDKVAALSLRYSRAYKYEPPLCKFQLNRSVNFRMMLHERNTPLHHCYGSKDKL